MRSIKLLQLSPDVLLALLVGVVAFRLSFIPDLALARWIFGFVFIFFGSGYPITLLLPENTSALEMLLASGLVSLLLTYPASVLLTLLEGQSREAIFGPHLTNSLLILLLLSLVLALYLVKRQIRMQKVAKFPILLIIPLAVYALLSFTNLNRADVLDDEYDLGYQAYNLVDGILAGRKAYTVSFSGHPPLAMDIKHFSMNILEPKGLDDLEDWQFRVSEAFTGLLVIVAAFALTKELFSPKVAVVAAMLLSVNNYLVWMGRIFHREIYLTFFMTAALFFYIKTTRKEKQIYSLLAGLGFAAALLVKEIGLVILTIPLFDLLTKPAKRKVAAKALLISFLIFLPVIIYNLAAYLKTGYADVFFSNLTGLPRPDSTPLEPNPVANSISLISFLSDLYSPLIFTALVVAIIVSLIRRQLPHEFGLWLAASLFFFSLTAVRAYYFLFLTIPLVILLARVISTLRPKPRYFTLSLLVLASAWYSVKTNLVRSYSTLSETKPDGAVIVSRPLTQDFSLAARTWSQELGYKRLQSTLDNKLTDKDCLITSESMNSLAVRRYIGHRDEVKAHYLGRDYPSRYPRCPAATDKVIGEIFLISDQRDEAGFLDTVITDHLGNERFFLFRLAKTKLILL